MSSKTVYLCDHCGAECSGDQYASIGQWNEPVHGYSKERLGFALAKVFGISLDGKAIARITELEQQLAGEIKERQVCQGNMRELEKRLAEATAVPTADGKTPGEVAYETWRILPGVRFQYAKTKEWDNLAQFEREEWEAIARAVLRAFPTRVDERVTAPMSFDFYFGDLVIPGHISPDELQAMIEASVGKQIEAHTKTFERDVNQRTAEALGRVRERIRFAETHWHQDINKNDAMVDKATTLAIIDAELAKLGAQNITDPSKPTKPISDHVHELGSCTHCDTQGITDTQKPTKPLAVACGDCGGTGILLSGQQCPDCKGAGYLS
jgi:hypothetical protein